MTRGDSEHLYQTWQKAYRPKASGLQARLVWGAAGFVLAAITLHWLLALSPDLAADLARLDLPYRPWYLAEQPQAATRNVGSTATSEVATQGSPGSQAVAQKRFLVSRPNLVPVHEERDPEKERQAVLSYLSLKAQASGGKNYATSTEADGVAQGLVERYAAGGPEALQGEYEQKLLADGWLWNVWRGCQAETYLSFPSKLIDEMGCGPNLLPAGVAVGIGLSAWRGAEGESAPVFALVWQGAREEGGAR